MKKDHLLLSFFLFFLLIIFDQWSKYLIRYSDRFYICNQGIAFGIKIDSIFFYFFLFLAFLFIFLQINSRSKKSNAKQRLDLKFYNLKNLWAFLISDCLNLFSNYDSLFGFLKKYYLALILILAGALSNLIDRFIYGCVFDFIDIHFLNYPLFNFADIFIVTGGIWLALKITKKNKLPHKSSL